MPRQVFFSFEFMKDAWRAAQIRNLDVVDDDSTFSDNDWEEVKVKSDKEIKKWIDDQMKKRSCIIVLVGETTFTRRWVKYEIQRAYELNKGIFGIYVHNLEDQNGDQCEKGENPFEYVFADNGKQLSAYVKCYDPPYFRNKNVYKYIKDNIEDWIEDAIENKAP